MKSNKSKRRAIAVPPEAVKAYSALIQRAVDRGKVEAAHIRRLVGDGRRERDLLAYREKSLANRRKALDELSKQAQELNMGY